MDIAGPGIHSFVLQTGSIDPTKIPAKDIVGITAVLLTGSYQGKEFFRVGYYVNVFYGTEELQENPPSPP